MSEKKDLKSTFIFSRSILFNCVIWFIGYNLVFISAMFILSLFPLMAIEPFSWDWFKLYLTLPQLFLLPYIFFTLKKDNIHRRSAQVLNTILFLCYLIFILSTLALTYRSNYHNAEREKREIANAQRLYFEELYSQGKYEVILQESQNVELNPSLSYWNSPLYYHALALCQLDRIDEAKDVFQHIADVASGFDRELVLDKIDRLNSGIELKKKLVFRIDSSQSVHVKYSNMKFLAIVYQLELLNEKKALETYEQMAHLAHTDEQVTFVEDKIRELKEGK